MFFHFYKKNCKKHAKTLNYSIHSSKKHRQYESNKVNNTATKHSLWRVKTGMYWMLLCNRDYGTDRKQG